MPPLEKLDRKQLALLWALTDTVDDFGVASVSAVRELKVRWNHTSREGLDAQGLGVVIEADVVVDRDISEGSVMWLGGLDDLPGTATVPEQDLMEVVSFKKTPDIKGRNFFRTVSLKRRSNVLPAIE